jgi:hypothetical protein
MFEHLDSPDTLDPGASELNDVLRRAASIRGRRHRMMTVAVCVVLLAASAGFFFTRKASLAPESVTDYQFNLRTGPLPIGLPVPTTALVDVDFATPQEGYALAIHRDTVILAASNDGGASWAVRNNGLPTTAGPQSAYPGQMEFIGSTGYLWGIPGDADSPLWISHDAGSTWQQASLDPYVFDVSAIGPNVWALAGTCPQNNAAGSCAVHVEESLDEGMTWTPIGPLDSFLAGTTGGAVQPVELARITTTRAYVLTDAAAGSSPGPLHWQLAFTADAGTSWTDRDVPCSSLFDSGVEVAASSTTDLWLLCGGAPATGAQIKELYRSSDGGLSWRLESTTSGQVWPMTVAPTDPLPVQGYIAPLESGHRNLAVASPTTAWLYPGRAGLYETTDGGLDWPAVPDVAAGGFASGGEGNITFLSATEGWICAYGVGLWQTDDGVHWHPVGQG